MPGLIKSGRVYHSYAERERAEKRKNGDDPIKKGFTPDVDKQVKRKKVEQPAITKLFPQRLDNEDEAELEQYEDAKQLEFSKLMGDPEKNDADIKQTRPGNKGLGKGYGKRKKGDDSDDIQNITGLKRPRSGGVNYRPTAEVDMLDGKANKQGSGNKQGENKGRQTSQADRMSDVGLETYSNVKPFVELLEKLAEEECDPENHIFPTMKPKCADYLWSAQGARGAGKTSTWKGVFPRFSYFYPYVYCHAQTKFANQFGEYMPNNAIFKGFSEAVHWKLLQIQEQKCAINLRLYDYWSEHEDPYSLYMIPNPYIYMLWDDTVAGRNIHDSPVLDEIAYYGRHYRMAGWINTQHGHALNPGFRANTDVPIGFRQGQKNQRETFREEYFGWLPKKADFDALYDKFTQKRAFIAFDRRNMEDSFTECVYSGIPDPSVKPIRVGCYQYWDEME